MSGENPTTIQSAKSAPDLRRDLISPQQLAAELKMSLRTLQRHHDARTGPPRITLGKHIYYRRATVEAWLQTHEGFGQVLPARSLRRPVSRAQARNARRAPSAV